MFGDKPKLHVFKILKLRIILIETYKVFHSNEKINFGTNPFQQLVQSYHFCSLWHKQTMILELESICIDFNKVIKVPSCKVSLLKTSCVT